MCSGCATDADDDDDDSATLELGDGTEPHRPPAMPLADASSTALATASVTPTAERTAQLLNETCAENESIMAAHSLHNVAEQLCRFMRRAVRPTPWKCALNIADTLKIQLNWLVAL